MKVTFYTNKFKKREGMDMYNYKINHDEEYAWDTYTFYNELEEELGYFNIIIHEDKGFLYSISSYKKGFGKEMINFIVDELYINVIEGDADPDSIGFWNKFNPIWDGESFEIEFS